MHSPEKYNHRCSSNPSTGNFYLHSQHRTKPARVILVRALSPRAGFDHTKTNEQGTNSVVNCFNARLQEGFDFCPRILPQTQAQFAPEQLNNQISTTKPQPAYLRFRVYIHFQAHAWHVSLRSFVMAEAAVA